MEKKKIPKSIILLGAENIFNLNQNNKLARHDKQYHMNVSVSLSVYTKS